MKQRIVIFWCVVLLRQISLDLFAFADVQEPSSQGLAKDQSYEISQRYSQPSAGDGSYGSTFKRSRQSRCVRCYEDRYGDDQGRYYGGYSSRSGDERTNWFYPNYGRHDDRYRTGEYYTSYNRERDDRFGPRSYDRYEGRTYDRYDRKGNYEYDRPSDYYRERYYERPRTYDRDNYDRYNARYDYRNYRPWDETYRGQSGFDNAGRGYYFANDKRQRLHSSPIGLKSNLCETYKSECGYESHAQVTSRPIYDRTRSGSDSHQDADGFVGNIRNTSSGRGAGWIYINEQNKSTKTTNENNRTDQSSSYGGRPPRPLGGSYLFDRDSNTVIDPKANENAAVRNDGSPSENAKGRANPPQSTSVHADAGDKQ